MLLTEVMQICAADMDNSNTGTYGKSNKSTPLSASHLSPTHDDGNSSISICSRSPKSPVYVV